MINSYNKKVNVFLVGSRKCATTSLANFLGSHEDISLSQIKEPNYFSKENKLSLDEYHNLFNWNKKIRVDASTSYTTHDKASHAIHNYNPKAKIIFIVRDPIERIYSHYRMSYERGDIQTTLKNAIYSHKLLIQCSQYYNQISPFVSKFGKENILILNNESLTSLVTENHLLNFLCLSIPFDSKVRFDNTANSDYRMPKHTDYILTNKYFHYLKSIFPKYFVRMAKSFYYRYRNRKLSTILDIDSKNFIRSELLEDLYKFSLIINFDIDNWIQKIKKL